jgi:short-subunit dehydrogenase
MNTVLITGTSRGIGKSLKEAFEQRGDLVVGYRRDELGDIRDPLTIASLKELAEDTQVNILVNNAGLYSDKWLNDISEYDILQIIDVNLIVPMLLTKALWSTLKVNKGTVVFMNSFAGRFPAGGEIAYRASKYGLTGFSSSLYNDGKRDGVRVLDIPFGGINTDMLKDRPGIADNPLLQPSEAAKLIIQILDSSDSKQIKHLILQGRIIDTRNSSNIGEM